MLTRAERDLRMGLWRIHILHHAAQRPVWGTWLLEELAAHGHRLSPGTLYPALARLERHGWLRRSGRAAHSRARQSFRITEAGRQVLQQLRQDIAQLHGEIVVGQDGAHASRAVGGSDHRAPDERRSSDHHPRSRRRTAT